MTLSQIDQRLEELKLQKQNISGTETEVYARIVGYYRSVRNWNKGKKEEYGKRLNYQQLTSEAETVSVVPEENLHVEPRVEQAPVASEPDQYLFFSRKTCPNCPPVSRWLNQSGFEGRQIDVDRESGLHEARRYNITTAPTVVFLDRNGLETGRGSSVNALAECIRPAVALGA